MIHIAFDYQIFSSQKFGGISRYYVNLVDQISRMDKPVNARIIAPLHQNRYLKSLSKELSYGKFVNRYPPKSTKLVSKLNKSIFEYNVKKWNPKVIHETYYSDVHSNFSCPTVVTVHDMIHEIFTDKFPNNDYTSIYKKNSVERADHIICISESTKSDLINVFNIDEKKISVTHHGVSSLVTTLDRYSLVKKHHNPYILYVGNRWGHKNFNRLIKAFASSKNLVKDFDVVSFGGNKFNDNELALFNKLGLKDKVFHYVGDDMCLSEFYNQANIFVYPSLYEGFGLPPLEAMANNCAVASNNTSSMPEVIGNAGEFFDPYDLDDIKQAIENVVYSNKRTNELLSFGIKRASEFTWEKCAEETLNVYKKYL